MWKAPVSEFGIQEKNLLQGLMPTVVTKLQQTLCFASASYSWQNRASALANDGLGD